MNKNITSPETPPHVAIVPTPWMGHLIPLVEFAKRLVLLPHHHFHVTIFLPTDGSPIEPQKALLQALPPSISTIFLPPASLHDLPESTKIETRITLTVTRSLPSLHDSLKLIPESTRPVAMVVDLFGLHAFEIAKQFGVPSYLFFPSNATCLSFFLNLPKLDQSYPGEYRDMPEPLTLPGCVPVHGCDFPDPFQDRQDKVYGQMIESLKMYNSADGILVNGFIDLEPEAFKALNDHRVDKTPPVYPVGPLIRSVTASEWHDHEGLRTWLDKQPPKSVIFVSFGSGGTLSHEQILELALGLEMSEQRFVWVIRSQPANGLLPNGFVERTKGVGVVVVVPNWGPQVEVLSHGSTGGFISHCGWNSTLESIVHGVPIIAWPLYAEQKMNAIFLSQGIKVAIRVSGNSEGVVSRSEVAKCVKGLIGGEEGRLIRDKMRDLKIAAAMALSEDGSSTRSFIQVAEIWNTSPL